jgi:hypothetical protein
VTFRVCPREQERGLLWRARDLGDGCGHGGQLLGLAGYANVLVKDGEETNRYENSFQHHHATPFQSEDMQAAMPKLAKKATSPMAIPRALTLNSTATPSASR